MKFNYLSFYILLIGVIFSGCEKAIDVNLDEGTLNIRHTVWAILIAHTFFNASIAIRIVSTYWEGLDDNPENQARILGTNKVRTFFEITIPPYVRRISG